MPGKPLPVVPQTRERPASQAQLRWKLPKWSIAPRLAPGACPAIVCSWFGGRTGDQ